MNSTLVASFTCCDPVFRSENKSVRCTHLHDSQKHTRFEPDLSVVGQNSVCLSLIVCRVVLNCFVQCNVILQPTAEKRCMIHCCVALNPTISLQFRVILLLCRAQVRVVFTDAPGAVLLVFTAFVCVIFLQLNHRQHSRVWSFVFNETFLFILEAWVARRNLFLATEQQWRCFAPSEHVAAR